MQATQPNNPPQTRMTLASVQTGRIAQPLRLVLYGPPGIGKSTFAAAAPAPIFLGAEKGTAELDVARFPQPETWAEVHEALRTLYQDEHSFKTLVIDTLDWLEPLCHAAVCAKHPDKPASVDDIPYGRGFNAALDEWRLLLKRIERLCDARGLNVIMLAHCHIKTFKAPDSEHYDRYEMKLHAKASGLIQEWADEVLYTQYETLMLKDASTKRVRGVSSGARVIHTVRDAAWDAKNRHSLPDTLPLSWDEYAAAVELQAPASASDLKAAIEALTESEGADAGLVEQVGATVAKAKGNPAALAKILDRLKAKLGGQES